MSDFWLGVLVALGALVAIPAILTVVAGLLRWAYDYGQGMVKASPREVKNRSEHAAVVYVARRLYRPLWIAGWGVYVMRQDNSFRWGGESRLAWVEQGIREMDAKWRDKKFGSPCSLGCCCMIDGHEGDCSQ